MVVGMSDLLRITVRTSYQLFFMPNIHRQYEKGTDVTPDWSISTKRQKNSHCSKQRCLRQSVQQWWENVMGVVAHRILWKQVACCCFLFVACFLAQKTPTRWPRVRSTSCAACRAAPWPRASTWRWPCKERRRPDARCWDDRIERWGRNILRGSSKVLS